MKGLLLISLLLLGAILTTKSETNEEKIPLKANDIKNKEQNIANRIEEEELEIQNISQSKKAQKNKKKQKQKQIKRKRKRAKKLRKKSAKGKNKETMKKKKKKAQKNKKKRKQKQKQIKRKRAKKLRKKSGKAKGKNKETMKNRKKKQNRTGKKKRKQIKKKKKNDRKRSKKTKRKKKTNKRKRKKKVENDEKEKPKKKFRKKIGKNLGVKVTIPSCDEIILSRIKLERKAVNYMRQFNRSTRFMGKTENKLKKKDIWQKSTLKDPQDPISLLIKCGGGDENNLKCAGSTSNKNSVTMMTLLSNLKNCTPNIGSDCKEDKFPAKDGAFDGCAKSLMGFQAMSQECLKKDGAGACDCYKKADAVTLYDAGKACDAPKMQQYERSVLKTKDNCVTKFKDCRKYQDELASVMMLCCGEGGECKAS